MKGRWVLAETAALFAADQIIKTGVEQKLDLNEERNTGRAVRIRRVHNKGMAFGFLAGHSGSVKWLSFFVAAAVTGVQIAELIFSHGFIGKMASGMLSAGAWSNTFDRFARGYVVDYLGFSVKNERAGKLTYNLGDFLITAGVSILAVRGMFGKKRPEKSAAERIGKNKEE